MELNGVALFSEEDTTDAMTDCFIEEFARLGYNHKQLLALFRNPHYIGMNMALQNRGEQFVRDRIAEYFARRGKQVTWPGSSGDKNLPGSETRCSEPQSQVVEHESSLIDPTGAPIPKVNL